MGRLKYPIRLFAQVRAWLAMDGVGPSFRQNLCYSTWVAWFPLYVVNLPALVDFRQLGVGAAPTRQQQRKAVGRVDGTRN